MTTTPETASGANTTGDQSAEIAARIDRVAWAINQAWNKFGEVPFPLYQHEAEALAEAAVAALDGLRSPVVPGKV